MTKNYIILGLCLLLIGVVAALIFRPAPPPQATGTITKQQEEELKATIVTLEGQNDSLRQELAKVTQKETVAQEGFKRAIATLQRENRRLSENPKVVEVRTNVPEVDSLLALKDIIIERQSQRIGEMEVSANVLVGINEKIQKNLEQRLSLTEQLLLDSKAELDQERGQNKKLRRKLLFTKIAGIAVLTGVVVLSL